VVSDPAEAEVLEQERRLVEAAQHGNLDALRPIFERYAAPLYAGILLPRIGNAAAAEEVLRDTFSTAVEKIGGFRWQGRTLYPWLRQIAVNKAHDHHRRAQRSQRLADALATETPTATAIGDRADAQLIAAEEHRANRARIEAAMAALSARYRTAIQLRLVDELPRDECARTMNVTVGTFDVLLFRAVRAFRKQFGERDA
jgi:RNA polymerase sigma-70 factor (ECF subfamily)